MNFLRLYCFLSLVILIALNLVCTPVREVPPGNINFFIAIDNSSSYGMTKQRREKPSKEVFEAAKEKLIELLSANVFKQGDNLLGLCYFTDQSMEDITPLIINAKVDSASNIEDRIKDTIGTIRLREVDEYKTYYRNVLDKADIFFRNAGSKPEQSLCVILTDERGSEVEGYESYPENDTRFNVIKLVALAVGGGRLEFVVNKNIKTATGSDTPKYAVISGYVEDIRTYYKQVYTQERKEFNPRLFAIIAACSLLLFGIFLFIYFKYFKKEEEILRQIWPDYNSGTNELNVRANFPLPIPEAQEDKVLNYSIEDIPCRIITCILARDGYMAYLTIDSRPPTGQYKLIIDTEKGSIRGMFVVKPPPDFERRYKLVARKMSDFLGEEAFLLDKNFVTITEALGTKAKIDAKIDDYNLYLKASRSKVLKEDRSVLLGIEKYRLPERGEKTIVLSLPDENDEYIQLEVSRRM